MSKTIYKNNNIIHDISNKDYETKKHLDMYMPVSVLGTKEEISQIKLQEANRYITNVTNNFIAQMSLAESYVGSRDFDKAQEEFEKALLSAQTNEEKFTVNHNLAVIYYQKQDYKTALSYAQIANSLSDDIENKNSYEIQAYCYADLKEYKKAEKYELIFTNSEKYKGSQVTKDDEGEELSEEEAAKFEEFIDKLESNDDVQSVWHNADI